MNSDGSGNSMPQSELIALPISWAINELFYNIENDLDMRKEYVLTISCTYLSKACNFDSLKPQDLSTKKHLHL